MADLSLLDKLFSYEELLDAEKVWRDFFKSQLSSLYDDNVIHSTQYSIIIRAFSRILGGLDLLFERSYENMSLEDVLTDFLYTNFGFLLEERPNDFSREEYRTFLVNLVDILFKGLTISVAKNDVAAQFDSTSIAVEFAQKLRNTSLGVSGMDQENSNLDVDVPTLGLILDGDSEAAFFQSSKENNDVYVVSRLGEDSSFHATELSMVAGIVDLLSSAIAPPQVRLVVNSQVSSFNTDTSDPLSPYVGSQTELLETFQSITNFQIIDTHIRYVPEFVVKLDTEYVVPGDTYDTSRINEPTITISPEYVFLVDDFYNVTTVTAENPPRVDETASVVPVCAYYGSITYGSFYYECAGPFSQYTSPFSFGTMTFGEFLGELVQPQSVVSDELEIGNFIIA